MVEVPAVAIEPDLFGNAAFFSIGSNDLTQYVTASARDIAAVAASERSRQSGGPQPDRRVVAAGAAASAAMSASAATWAATRATCPPSSLRAPDRLGRAAAWSAAPSSPSPRPRRPGHEPDGRPAGRRLAGSRGRPLQVAPAARDRTRPSGTRQRLAGALGKNRSFVSQITNPAYATPIPARHIEIIFEICHFSPRRAARLLAAYAAAHPRRLPVAREDRRLRAHTIYLPDLGDEKRNRELDRMVADFVQRLTRLIASRLGPGRRT